MSRYGITTDDLIRASKNLQIGDGLADRISGTDTDIFIVEGEDWADNEVSDFIAVPMRPVSALGESSVGTVTSRNYPLDFIKAATYWALARLIASEYAEHTPNTSQSSEYAEQKAYLHMQSFRSRPTTRVGAGRRRNPNPFMPPNIQPKETFDQSQQGGQ